MHTIEKITVIFIMLPVIVLLCISCPNEVQHTAIISFDARGGVLNDDSSKEVTCGHMYGALPNPTRDGYSFDGWWTTPDGYGVQIVAENYVNIMESQTLYARWLFNVFTGPAGGYVFYDKGYFSDGWQYLEAAPQDLSTGIGGSLQLFGYHRLNPDSSNRQLTTTTIIGFGETNTATLVENMSDSAYTNNTGTETTDIYAAKLCAAYVFGGYTDWFLPSQDELNEMYLNLKVPDIGAFSDNIYWCSSESGSIVAWSQDFSDGDQISNTRNDRYRVRPIRAY